MQGAQEAMAEMGALAAMAGHLRGLGLGPLCPAPTAGTLSTPPPQKKFPGVVRGYQEPSGAKQDSTGQDRKALRGQTDRTRQLTGTGSPPGLAWKLRLPLGMTRSQGPSQGPSATCFQFCDRRGRRLGLASMATTRGAPKESPWTRQDKVNFKCSCGHNKTNTALLAMTFGLNHVWLGSAAAGGLESATGRRPGGLG